MLWYSIQPKTAPRGTHAKGLCETENVESDVCSKRLIGRNGEWCREFVEEKNKFENNNWKRMERFSVTC